MQQQQVAPRPCVPQGYRFNPTQEELIRYYLNPWVTAGKNKNALLFNGIVCVADIYAMDPDALTSRFHDSGHDGNWYFLCVARWKNGKASSRRMSRSVRGGGTWHGSSKRRPVGVVGHRQGYEYRARGNEKTVWIMEVLTTNLDAATDAEGVKVLCRVYHSPRAQVDEEQETKNKVGSSNCKRPKLLTQEGEYDVDRSYSASTSSAAVSVVPLDGEHGLAAYLMPVAPSPAECYAGVEMAQFDGEHGLAAYSMSAAAPSQYEYYSVPSQGAPESAAASATGQQVMTEQGMGVDGGLDIIVREPEPLEQAADIGDMKGLPLPPMDFSLDVDVTTLNAQMNDGEWLDNIEFYYEDTENGVEGGHCPAAAT